MISPDILFEDKDLLIINKPAGVVVNRARTVTDTTIQDWFEERLIGEGLIKKSNGKIQLQATGWESLIAADFDEAYGTAVEIFVQRGGLVHRLDKDTSGALVLAKNPGSLVQLLRQFKQREVQKQYRCLTHGKFRVPEGIIRAPLDRASYNRQKMAVSSTGREAVTKYQVERYYAGFTDEAAKRLFDKQQLRQISIYQGFSLVTCWPQTGRTHQIRVHMKHWEHPLVGDQKYVGKKRSRLDPVWCPRQFLHAAEITVTHPRSKMSMVTSVPLSSDLQNILQLLTMHP